LIQLLVIITQNKIKIMNILRFAFALIFIFNVQLTIAQDDINYTADKPFHYISKWKNGQKKSEGELLNSLEEGNWIFWNESGVKIQEVGFTEGKFHGLMISYYDNGKKNNEVNYYYGIKNGLYNEWYENGKQSATGKFTLGHRDSVWTYYTEEGKVSKKEMYNHLYDNPKII